MRTAALLLCLLLGSKSYAQQAPVIRTETREVLVDTIVTDKKGGYVRDLIAKDFRLWEDNKEQVISSVVAEKTAAVSQPRYLVLFFAGIEPQDGVAARQAVAGFIDANTEADHMMAVVSYRNALQIGQNFTGSGARLKDAANRAIASGIAGGDSSFDALDTIRAIAQLGRNMSVLPGRKIIVFVNGGLSQASTQRAEMTAAIEACNKSDVAVYPIDIRPVSTRQGAKPIKEASEGADQRSMIGRRGGGPRGQTDDADAATANATGDTGLPNQQLLYRIASGTGGFVIANAGELQRGLQKVGEEQSEYYVLSYSPVESKDGSCHTLRVKVDRGGTTVRARSNYCQSKPQDLLAGTVSGQDLERKASSTPAGGTGASMQLSYFYLSPTVARVQVAMEIPASAAKRINFLGIASTTEGEAGARFSDEVNVAATGKPLHYEKEFKIAPGHYTFTMAFSGGGQNFGKLEMPLTVEARQAGELAMSGLVLSRETHPAAEAGLGLSSLTDASTPLVTDDVQIVPSGSNLFAKSEAGYFYFEAYTQDPASVRVSIRVLDRKTGEVKSDSGLLKLSLPKTGNTIPAGSRLPIDTLNPGTYELEITAVDSGGKQLKRTAAFEIR